MPRNKQERKVSDAEFQALKNLLKANGTLGTELAKTWGCDVSTVSRRLKGDLGLTRESLRRAYRSLGMTDETFAELVLTIERQMSIAGVGIPAPGTPIDFAQVRKSLRAIEAQKQRGARRRAERLLLELQECLDDVGPMEIPWVDHMAGILLNASDALTAAAAFQRAADGFYRYGLICRYEEARSYALAARRQPDDPQAAEWRSKATEVFRVGLETSAGDPLLHGGVCKTYAELLARKPGETDGLHWKALLFEQALYSYRLALAYPRNQGMQVQANCRFNIGYCLAQLGRNWDAVTEYLLSIRISALIPDEPGVAYVLKFLGITHSDLAMATKRGKDGIRQRHEQHAIAGWCAGVAVRMREEIERQSTGRPDFDTATQGEGLTDARNKMKLVFEREPHQANRYFQSIPEPKDITPAWVLESYETYLKQMPVLPESLTPLLAGK